MERKQIDEKSFLAAQWPPSPDKPTLVFIHGAASSALFWEFQLEALGDRVNAVAVDLPGHGRDGRKARETISAYAEAVKDFAEQLEMPRPIPCGLSMGGAIVQTLLLDSPEVFPAGIIVNSGARLKTDPFIFEMIEKDYKEFGEMVFQWGAYEENRSERLRKMILRSAAREPETALKDFKACHEFDLMEEVGTIKTPVLVLAAKEDLLTPLKYSEFLAKNIENSRLVVIEKAGHLSPLERPEEVNEALGEFVSDIEGLR